MSSKSHNFKRSSAAWRIAAWPTVVFAVDSAVAFTIMYLLIASDIRHRSDDWLSGEAETLADVSANTPRDRVYERMVQTVAFTADLKRAVTISSSECVAWDVEKGAMLARMEGWGGVNSITLFPDGSRLVVGDERVRIWDLTNGNLLRTLVGPTRFVDCLAVALTPEGLRIATGWSEPVPGRVCLPLWTSAFHGARFWTTCCRQTTDPQSLVGFSGGLLFSTTRSNSREVLFSSSDIPGSRCTAGADTFVDTGRLLGPFASRRRRSSDAIQHPGSCNFMVAHSGGARASF
jgi:WD40 repeat protein